MGQAATGRVKYIRYGVNDSLNPSTCSVSPLSLRMLQSRELELVLSCALQTTHVWGLDALRSQPRGGVCLNLWCFLLFTGTSLFCSPAPRSAAGHPALHLCLLTACCRGTRAAAEPPPRTQILGATKGKPKAGGKGFLPLRITQEVPSGPGWGRAGGTPMRCQQQHQGDRGWCMKDTGQKGA